MEIVAVDAFLKGCSDKNAALTSTNRNPKSLNEALKLVKCAMTKNKVIYWSKKSELRRVSFEESDEESTGIVKRAVNKDKGQIGSRRVEDRWRKT
ncbi:hypothetical protein KP79_PYT09715 [Mizuhopecten yessoensis]|uniref:Uncharacterized protein n=1 Tax=Mizuhopecten yessoensis TaxID=6573 RepID=A0A210QCL7_MIZYE|nr:hypothetical protein KP79_PYT09715 [Mizuhopecten yessoensis]